MFGTFRTQDGAKHELPPRWDLIIAHPPCTYLSNGGARWLYAGGKLNYDRYKKGMEALNFFVYFLNAPCDQIAIVNPIPSKIYHLPQYTQIIQPYEHGHPWSKKTCLWLKGLPPLLPTEIVTYHKPFCSSGSYSTKSRSKIFPGIARAMAEQWGGNNNT